MAKYLPDMRIGDDYNVKLVVDVSGVPVDITGYKFTLTLKKSYSDLDNQAVLKVSTISGSNPNDDAVNGICFLSVDNLTTANIETGSYFYDLQEEVGSSKVTVYPPIEDYDDRLKVYPQINRG